MNGASPMAVPFVAGSNIAMNSAQVTVDVYDTDGVTVLCQTTIQLGSKSGLSVTEGASTAVSYDLALAPGNCEVGVTGEIAISGLPADAGLSYGYAYANGPTYKNAQFNTLPYTYKHIGLAAGDYRPYANLQFNGTLQGASLNFPYYNQAPVKLTATSGLVTRDLIYAVTPVSGSVTLSGPWAGRLYNGSVSLSG